MSNVLHNYESIRILKLSKVKLPDPSTIPTYKAKFRGTEDPLRKARRIKRENETEQKNKKILDQYKKDTANINNGEVEIPDIKIIGPVVVRRDFNLIDELTITLRADFIEVKMPNRPHPETYYPLMDPNNFRNLRVSAQLGYKRFFKDLGNSVDNGKFIVFNGVCTGINPSFQADGRPVVTLTFYDDGFDMVKVPRTVTYPHLDYDVDGGNQTHKANYLKTVGDGVNTSNTSLEDLTKNINKNTEIKSQIAGKSYDRSWAKIESSSWGVDPDSLESPIDTSTREISLGTIIEKILSLCYDNVTVRHIPERFYNVTYTPENPLTQNMETDWVFIRRLCDEQGATIYRSCEGSQVIISIYPTKESMDNRTEERWRFVVNRQGHHLYDYNSFQLDGDILDTRSSEIKLPSSIAPEQIIETKGFKNFVIKDGLDININMNNNYGGFESYISESGEPIVIAREVDENGDYKEIQYELNLDAINSASNDTSIQYLKDLFKNGIFSTWEETKKYLIPVQITREGNDKTDKSTAYPVYIWQGWSASFRTIGNPYAFPGNWYYIDGLGPQFYQRFCLKSLTHTFDHTWNSEYEVER